MSDFFNRHQGVIAIISLVVAAIFFFLDDKKLFAALAVLAILIVVAACSLFGFTRPKKLEDVIHSSRVLFIDDKECQIAISLQRNDWNVRKIDDVDSVSNNTDIQWANVIFVDFKGVGKKLFKKKEGMGLVRELKRTFGRKKRYVMYSSVQDFEGFAPDIPYIRPNASYDEFVSLIATEVSKL